jgi:hypothetical protein
MIVGMSSDQFYEWKPTLKWRKYFWTGKWTISIRMRSVQVQQRLYEYGKYSVGIIAWQDLILSTCFPLYYCKCNVYILTMKINRTLWLTEVINLFRRWQHWRKYIFIYHLYLKCMLFTSKQEEHCLQFRTPY